MNFSLSEAKPFFIIGNPRSGTTLLRLMLNNHPNIVVPPECGFSMWYYDKYRHGDFSQPETRKLFLEDLYRAKKIETWDLNRMLLEEVITDYSPKTYSEITKCVYISFAKQHGKNPLLIGDKNNFYLDYFSEIKELYTDAKFICIIRDGRDVACSYRALNEKAIDSIYAPKLSSDIQVIAEEWKNNNLKIIHYSDEATFIVKYEDLISNPRLALQKICHFLGEKYDSAMLNYYQKNLLGKQEPPEFLQWKEKTCQSVDPKNFGKYKTILKGDENEQFNTIAGDILSFFDYEV